MLDKNIGLKRILSWILFLAYLMVLVYLCFFSGEMGRNHSSYGYNLVPFREIKRYYAHIDTIGTYIFVLNIVGNVVAFMPFGFFRPLLGVKKLGIFKTVIQGALFSLFIETSQLLVQVGSFDVDDIILNTLGTFAGYLVFSLFNKIYRRLIKNVWKFQKK